MALITFVLFLLKTSIKKKSESVAWSWLKTLKSYPSFDGAHDFWIFDLLIIPPSESTMPPVSLSLSSEKERERGPWIYVDELSLGHSLVFLPAATQLSIHNNSVLQFSKIKLPVSQWVHYQHTKMYVRNIIILGLKLLSCWLGPCGLSLSLSTSHFFLTYIKIFLWVGTILLMGYLSIVIVSPYKKDSDVIVVSPERTLMFWWKNGVFWVLCNNHRKKYGVICFWSMKFYIHYCVL